MPANASVFDVNPNPVIGVVSQPISQTLKKDPRFDGKETYIM